MKSGSCDTRVQTGDRDMAWHQDITGHAVQRGGTTRRHLTIGTRISHAPSPLCEGLLFHLEVSRSGKCDPA